MKNKTITSFLNCQQSFLIKKKVDFMNQKRLSSGANNTVIVLDDKAVAKLFTKVTKAEMRSEAEKMKYANNINNLVAKFIKLERNLELKMDMLVMERIKPIDFRAFEVEKRELWFNDFQYKIIELHKAGFVHHDLIRPTNFDGFEYDNILLSENGLRLIDVGISAIRSQVGDLIFNKYVQIEIAELIEFKEFFLN